MANDFKLLKPYRSSFYGKNKDSFIGQNHQPVLEDIVGMFSLGDTERRRLISRFPAQQDEELEVGYLHFEEIRPVTWTVNPSISRYFNHLVVAVQRVTV